MASIIRLLLRASLCDLCAPLHLNLAIHPKKRPQRPAISGPVEAPSNIQKKKSSDFAVGFSKMLFPKQDFGDLANTKLQCFYWMYMIQNPNSFVMHRNGCFKKTPVSSLCVFFDNQFTLWNQNWKCICLHTLQTLGVFKSVLWCPYL